jgi:hypothetical protein
MADDGGGLPNVPVGSTYNNPLGNYGSIVEMTDTEELLYRLELNLGGKDILNGVVVDSGVALMNGKGIKDVMMIVKSACNRVEIMSHFEKKEIMLLMEFLNDSLCKCLMLNRINYGFSNPSGRDLVVVMANFCIYAVISRGKEGGERRFWKGSQQDINIKGKQEKGGLFSGLFKR